MRKMEGRRKGPEQSQREKGNESIYLRLSRSLPSPARFVVFSTTKHARLPEEVDRYL